MSTTIRNLLALRVHPVLWRFIGFVSSLVGFICFAMSPPFNKLFEYGELGLLGIVIYCALASLVFCTMLCTTRWGLTKNTVLTAHVVFFVLMVTSVYSFYLDKTEQGKEREVFDKVLNLISCGAFALMSLSLSRLSGIGFETGMFNFFLGSVMMVVMKWNIKFAFAAAIFCYILINIRTISDSQQETNNQKESMPEIVIHHPTNISPRIVPLPRDPAYYCHRPTNYESVSEMVLPRPRMEPLPREPAHYCLDLQKKTSSQD